MKKLLSILLCLAMLVGTAVLFSSCEKEINVPKASKKVVEVDLAEYSIVYSGELPSLVREAVTAFPDQIKAATGVKIKSASEKMGEPLETEAREILVGQTPRVETQDALKSIGGHGWVIKVTDHKIVIVGTTMLLTKQALDYFVESFLVNGTVNETKITLNKTVSNERMEMVTLVDEGEVKSLIVHADGLDTEQGSPYGTEGNGNDYDYPVAVANNVNLLFKNVASLGENALAVQSASAEVPKKTTEVIVGNVGRAEMQECLAGISAKQYGVCVRDGKVLLAAWNDTALESAMTLFDSCIRASAVTEKDGVTVVLPADLSIIQTLDNDWSLNFPKPEGENISLIGTQDVGDGWIEYVYQGAGVSADAYNAYCEKLLGDKFELVASNANSGNLYSTYTSIKANVALHVSYNPYSYATEQGVADLAPSIRVLAANRASANLPDSTLLKKNQYYLKMNDSMITSVPTTRANGDTDMCYIITLEDGSYIIVDGGANGKTGMGIDHIRIWNVLNDLYVDARGYAPTADEPITIAAWIITHQHKDNYNVFRKFCERYGKNGAVVERLLANFTSEAMNYNSYDPDTGIVDNWDLIQESFADGLPYVKMHTGHKYYLGNATIEVLYTHEDLYPKSLHNFNDSSVVFRVTLEHRDEYNVPTGKKTSMLFTGDTPGDDAADFIWGLRGDESQRNNIFGADQWMFDLLS
ncbi:MAG: hypothetical protein IJF08_03310, partial [Clostridia bacterium]|nr:hypothetical protein [Clostridia bacterium]